MDSFRSLDKELAGLQKRVEHLQSQIAQIQVEMRHLHTRRNALTSLCRLPHEILLMVMMYLTTSQREASQARLLHRASDSESFAPEWARIMDVCTRLRSTARALPLLWSHIDLEAPHKWNLLCAERAGTTPLSVAVPNVSHGGETQKLRVFSRRIQSISIADGTHVARLKQIFANAMPLLSSARFTSPHLDRFYDLALLSRDTLKKVADRLTQLSADKITISSKPAPFPTLVRLDLWMLDLPDQRHAGNLLHLLSGTPMLRQLYLTNVYCNSAASSATAIRTVSLPHLEVIGISGNLEFLVMILPILVVPARGFYMVDYSGPRASKHEEMQRQAFDAASLSFGHSGTVPPIHIAKNMPGSGHRLPYCLWIEHRDSTALAMTYEDYFDHIEDIAPLLRRASTLHVHGVDALAYLLAFLTRNRLGPHCQPDHLVVEDVAIAVLTSLAVWLRKRVYPLKTLEFTKCGYAYCYGCSYGSVAEFGRAMVREGVVERVIDNGQPL
jgi:hypothetical protein